LYPAHLISSNSDALDDFRGMLFLKLVDSVSARINKEQDIEKVRLGLIA
jgi:hypothetical protein